MVSGTLAMPGVFRLALGARRVIDVDGEERGAGPHEV